MKKNLKILIESIIVGLLVFFLTVTNLLSSLDYMLRDRLYQLPRGINSKIKIIGIDEHTLSELGPVQTWSRSTYADLITKLNENPDAKPKLIGFDILFSGEVDEGDAALAGAAKQSGNVVIVDQLIYRSRTEVDEDGVRTAPVEGTDEPYDALAAVCKVGYSNMSLDSDGVVRRILPTQKYQGNDLSMFSKVLYDTYCELQGTKPQEIPVDRFGRSIINYSGRPGDYECVSLSDVLSGKIDTRSFRDSIVLVGAYAPGLQDNFPVPNGGSSQMYGVEIHANILQSYLQNRFAVSGNALIFGLITAILAMLLHFLFRKLKIWQGLILLLAAILAEMFFCVMLNNHGYTFSMVYFPLVLVLSFVYSLAIGYLLEQARRKKVLTAFRKYVAPQIVEEISKKGDFTIKLGGENRDIAVLFVDIRGFTTMSEALEPEQVVAILNEYLSLTTKSIFDNLGTLDKFVGDATMAVFNAPFDLPDYEFRAVSAAMDIVKGGEALEKDLLEKFGRSVGFGVGVHCGPAVVGNVGCDVRMDYTAIGDTVNTSARLEANAKKGQVLISDTLYERLKGRLEVEDVGEIPLKGKSKGVFVYSVKSLKGGVIEETEETGVKKTGKKNVKQTGEKNKEKDA